MEVINFSHSLKSQRSCGERNFNILYIFAFVLMQIDPFVSQIV